MSKKKKFIVIGALVQSQKAVETVLILPLGGGGALLPWATSSATFRVSPPFPAFLLSTL